MDPGWRHRLGLGVTVFALLTGCASLPGSKDASPPPAEVPAATPTIPEPVPVDVAQADAADDSTAEDNAEPPAPPGDLLDRVRAGFALGQHYNSQIDREADWFASHPDFVARVFNRAAPYLHYIVSEVESRGLPLELALLPFIESAFQPYAFSRARADGLWQFMPATGGRFGLKQDWWYDGRRDVVASTRAALDYLTYLRDLFGGNWLHAIAAYNCGEGNVRKAINRNKAAGKRTDFWNLKLPAETRGYVPRLLAMSRIVGEPEKYALEIDGIPDTPYFAQVETGGQMSIEVAAELAGITVEQMYDLNPAYHRWATDPTGPHQLLVPVESEAAFRESLLLLTPDQRLRVERYEVREGDTVTSIAGRFGTTPEHLRELNGLGSANTIQLGAELRVPSAVSALPENVRRAAARVDARGRTATVQAVHVVRKGESLWAIAKRHNIDVVKLAAMNQIDPTDTLRVGQRLKLTTTSGTAAAVAGNAAASGRQVTYVVRRGDTLSTIAQSLKVSVANLRSWNNLSGSNIKAGQKLVAYVRRGS